MAYPFGEPHGMDRINAVVIDCLLREGVDVSVATVCKKDLREYFKSKFGIDTLTDFRVHSIFPGFLSEKPIVSPFWEWISLKRALSIEEPDVVYIDGFKYRGLDCGTKHPRVIVFQDEPVSISNFITGSLSLGSLTQAAYSILYKSLVGLVQSKDLSCIDVCNSRWSANLFKRFFGKDAYVMYPPVSIEKFHAGKKEDLVTCVGVFNPRKRYEDVIDAVAFARTRPTLRIIGTFSPGYSWYVSKLRKQIEKLGASDRVHLHLSASFDELVSIIGRSKVCVSAGVEFFGIAVVEQMSAGCVPLVRNSFAPFTDIIDHGRYGFGFSTISQLQEQIDSIIGSPRVYENASAKAKERARFFGEETFRTNIRNLIFGYT